MALLNFPLAWVLSMELFLWICWALSLNHLNMHSLFFYFLMSIIGNHKWCQMFVSEVQAWFMIEVVCGLNFWQLAPSVITWMNSILISVFIPWWSKAYDYSLFLASPSTSFKLLSYTWKMLLFVTKVKHRWQTYFRFKANLMIFHFL